MNLELENLHVLITGGSKGIGLACAQVFLEEGARVTLVSRSADNLAAGRVALLAAHPLAADRIALVAADMTDAAAAVSALDRAEAAHGPVDVLVNSAGAAKRTPPDELTPQAWHDAMQAKYFSYIHMIDPAVQRMARRGAGVIINIVVSEACAASKVSIVRETSVTRAPSARKPRAQASPMPLLPPVMRTWRFSSSRFMGNYCVPID